MLLVAVALCCAVLRMAWRLGYLVMSSLTMNENLFAVMLANVHNLLVICCWLVSICCCCASACVAWSCQTSCSA
jgi:hypothetical protein